MDVSCAVYLELPFHLNPINRQNFLELQVLNQLNPARIHGSDEWNETTGSWSNMLSTADIPDSKMCVKAADKVLQRGYQSESQRLPLISWSPSTFAVT